MLNVRNVDQLKGTKMLV